MPILDRPTQRLTQRLAHRRVLVASGLLCAALAAVLFASTGRFSVAAVAAACGQPAPDVHVTTSAAAVEQFVVGCGEAGRAAYRDLQLVDLAYPAAIGVFVAACLASLLPRLFPRHPGVRALAVLPLLGAAFDYLENAGAWTLLAAHPDLPAAASRLVALASPAKQVTNWASSLLLVACLVGTSAKWLVAAIGRRQRTISEPSAPPSTIAV